MADYIYLLENRLSGPQRSALRVVREIAKAKGLTVFLVGGGVRDLTSGSPVRDLDVVVQGNALKLRKDIEKAGGLISGESEAGQALFVRFAGSVRMELGSTLSVSYPKPGKPVAKASTILEDLRRRDFTANAMALSLNEGSYGLLMDPLNGVADIENRELRLVSNYGFLEDPVRMIRAARLMARLGWTLDERTQKRYETGVEEGYISALSEFQRGYETEEIVHEEDPLRVLKRLETDGWMKFLAPFWTSAKANAPELERLRDVQTQLQMQGIHPDPASANFSLLTAKLNEKEVATLKKSFARQGFVAEVDGLEREAKEFAGRLGGKAASAPSEAWKIIAAASPEAVLWTAYANKSVAIQGKLKSFYTEWPQARTKIPYSTMQEMRIAPELPGYEDLLEKLFFELMDGRLQTPEEMKAFLEPFSPPAPPPPPSTRRPRAAKKEAKGAKNRTKKPLLGEDAEVEQAALAGVADRALAEEHEVEGAGAAAELEAEQVKEAPVEAAPLLETPSVPAKASNRKAGSAISGPSSAAATKAEPVEEAAVNVPAGKAPVVKTPAKDAGKRGPESATAAKHAAKTVAVNSGNVSEEAPKAGGRVAAAEAGHTPAKKTAANAPEVGTKRPVKTAAKGVGSSKAAAPAAGAQNSAKPAGAKDAPASAKAGLKSAKAALEFAKAAPAAKKVAATVPGKGKAGLAKGAVSKDAASKAAGGKAVPGKGGSRK